MAEAQLTNQLSRIDSMTNVELRAELKRRGCPTSGNKKDLLAKLRVALQKEYEQTALETASTTSTIDSNSVASFQQSPVVQYDVQRRQQMINSPTTPTTQFVNYQQPIHNADVPLTYHNLQMHDQTGGQYPSVYNLTMQQTAAAPTIPVPQQLTLSSAEPQISPMTTRQSRTSVDAPITSPTKKTRSRSKNPSVDSRPVEIPPVEPTISVPIEISSNDVQANLNENSTISSSSSKTIELEPFVSKKSDDEDQQKEKEEEEERRDSRSPSVGSSSAKSESVIKEIPLSGDRHRLSRSKSPKSRWHHSPSPQDQQINPPTIVEEPENPPSSSTKTTEPEVPKEPEEPKKQEEEKPAKINRSVSTNPSSSLMKGLNRTSGGNRMNLSSDVLKTLIPNISLAPESVVENELEATTNEETNGEDGDHSTMLETSVGSGAALLSDSMTIGDLADQRQQRNRTVVIDVAVDSSSLNDDLVGNNVETKKKTNRMASFESKPLLDGKTNALMMDEPVRVKDVTVAHEPASQIIFIRGLTRPFTPIQLKELLSHYGTCVDGEFWLDKIKSQCFVMYNSLEEAQNAREALDGCRWPSSNPKTLSVRFGRQDEFEFSKTRDLPPDQMSNETSNVNNRSVQEKVAHRRSASPTDEGKTTNNKKLRPMNNNNNSNDVREWDLPKLQQDKQTMGNERQVIEGESSSTATKKPETKAKGLDDYFRKTKAKPPIYWLPLTEEQVVEREQRREQRKLEREEEQRKRQNDENGRTSSNNRDFKSRPYRRSPSPRDKRKRVSTSPTSPNNSRRDNKRH